MAKILSSSLSDTAGNIVGVECLRGMLRKDPRNWSSGLEVEWQRTPCASKKPAALILCNGDECMIIQLLYLASIPEGLEVFLSSSRRIIVGVETAAKLWQDLMNNEQQRREQEPLNRCKIQKLAPALLGYYCKKEFKKKHTSLLAVSTGARGFLAWAK